MVGKYVMEVQAHIGADTVRCIMMAGSEGIARGMEVSATGNGICVPVGECTLGRMFNVLGEPIDGEGDLRPESRQPHTQEASRLRRAADRN